MERSKEVSKTTKQLVEMVGKLEPQEFIGLCKILGVEIYDLVGEDGEIVDARPEKLSVEEYIQAAASRSCPDTDDNASQTEEGTAAKPGHTDFKVQIRPAEVLIQEIILKISELNRTQSRNLKKLLKPATKGR